MRIILSLAALVAAAPPTASACGTPYLDIHPLVTEPSRAFVAFGEAQKVEGPWFPLWPRSYDTTMFAELPPEPARTLTLVGSKGATVVTATHRVALKDGWQLGEPHGTRLALEVPNGQYEIALDGKVDDAKWHALEYTYRPVQTTDIGLTVKNTAGSYEISSNGKVLRTGKGVVRGFVDAYGERFIVVDTDRDPHAIFLGWTN